MPGKAVLPWGRSALCLAIALAVGVPTAARPARSAARLDPLESISVQ
ncbi:hypothetical protein [Streptomyces sp. CT34]|nr:hypothetical protein [Streptomyces sp. CT34]